MHTNIQTLGVVTKDFFKQKSAFKQFKLDIISYKKEEYVIKLVCIVIRLALFIGIE